MLDYNSLFGNGFGYGFGNQYYNPYQSFGGYSPFGAMGYNQPQQSIPFGFNPYMMYPYSGMPMYNPFSAVTPEQQTPNTSSSDPRLNGKTIDDINREGTAYLNPTTGVFGPTPQALISKPVVTQTAPTMPQFGNLGARLDQGKTLTGKAERKLNKMGYTDQQLVQAGQAGGGKAGFQSALGGMTPGETTVKAPKIKPNTQYGGY